jgi:UDP-N-acetyl-2-amino-2-deoxyglucuronate dehydrogenase
MAEAKIKVALVGCGRISSKHLEAIYENREHLELVALCDTNPQAIAQVGIDVPAYDSIEKLLKNEKLDLVSLCTPSGLHPSQAIIAAQHGVHVITEKPMATRWADGLAMIKAFDQANKMLFVVKQNRLNPTVQILKKAIVDHSFGRIFTIQSNVLWSRPQSYYDQAAWRGTWEFDGGALMNQASHYVDLLEWLGGPIEAVQAMMSTQSRLIEVEDTAVINLKWRKGALGSMCVSMLTYPKNLEGSITILGEKGSAKLSGVALNKFETWEFEDKNVPTIESVNQLNYDTSSVYGNGHKPYYKTVIDALQGKAQAIADGREGLRSLELLIACYRSAQEQKGIHLPLEL